MMKVGGIWCSPIEIESCLITHPAVLEAAVIGQADADQLIKPKAIVVLKQAGGGGPALTEETDRASGKRPRALQIPALDRVRGRSAEDSDGKIQRFRICA
jgi:acyl-coenzyme A synthetase/AMP-(fatty) acid ligase